MHQINDDPKDLKKIFNQMKERIKSGEQKQIKFRIKALNDLLNGYEKMKPQIQEALKMDLGYSSFMSNFAAHSVTLGEVKDLIKGVQLWSKPVSVDTPLALGLASSSIQYQPLGLVLVISAWNYPIYTAIPQVAAAISAGNSVILKPSQMAPFCSNVLQKLFDTYMDKRYYRCLQGKVEIAKALTKLPFDLICFTGSTQTGRFVAIQAAKNLTPCLLQLGGKCPVIIDESAKMQSAVKRIIFGKFLNCGQTCVGVDHVYVHQSRIKQFKDLLLMRIQQAYGNNQQDVMSDGNYGKIINQHHLNRLSSYLNQNHGGKVLLGGQVHQNTLCIMPTVIQSPKKQSKLMTEQIFGPILPIFSYHDIQNVICQIQNRPKPLVVYMFSQDDKKIKLLKNKTSSGSFVVNDAVVQLLNCHLPFGGVGGSGSGRYHGHSGFLSFSNPKSICQTKAFNMYPLSTRFAPYTEHKKKMMTFLLKIGGVTYSQLGKGFGLISLIAIGCALGIKMKPNL